MTDTWESTPFIEEVWESQATGITWATVFRDGGAGGGGAVDSVNGQTGVVVLSLGDLDDVDLVTDPPEADSVLAFDETGKVVPATIVAAGGATAAQGALADTAVQPGDIGTAAAEDVGAFDAAGSAAAAQAAAIAASQPLDSDLTAIAALGTTSYGRSLLTLANQAALQAEAGGGGGSPFPVGSVVRVFALDALNASAGTIYQLISSTYPFAQVATAQLQNNYVEWSVFLGAGTWSMRVQHATTSGGGIITPSIDGVDLATIDTYTSGSVFTAQVTRTGIVIASAGAKLLRFRVATKNASSSAYDQRIAAVTFTRTA